MCMFYLYIFFKHTNVSSSIQIPWLTVDDGGIGTTKVKNVLKNNIHITIIHNFEMCVLSDPIRVYFILLIGLGEFLSGAS